MDSLAQTEWCSANVRGSPWGGLEAQRRGSRKASSSNGNQSVATTPPPWFPWGQDGRWSSGMAAAADVACTRLEGVAPGRGPGTWQAQGREWGPTAIAGGQFWEGAQGYGSTTSRRSPGFLRCSKPAGPSPMTYISSMVVWLSWGCPHLLMTQKPASQADRHAWELLIFGVLQACWDCRERQSPGALWMVLEGLFPWSHLAWHAAGMKPV